MDDQTKQNALAGGCPVAHDINPTNNMYRPNQKPHPDQKLPLETDRVTSSIPRTEKENWQYPSQQMFFNAMKRKNYEPNEEDMKVVIAIHNTVNEKCWEHVMEWENEFKDLLILFVEQQQQQQQQRRQQTIKSECCDVKLVKFRGRAKDFSPKARFLNFIGYKLPFDRHDWTVDRCGKQVRYVIDFYEGKVDPETNKPIGIYLDVRPAIDDLSTLKSRFNNLFK
ncbi:cytochrome c heme-lyase [Heterostelium album PN500]|uniref:Holocytochrome c-type synthase n=1 Tax=Heterostelium pallidum (strain ATCC 26659 / Pp 5 / PN500) TaxID=670386 RepID=D3BE16_HETP5|nr:cytochrome c heme-lyase [Heterostelium album PN500]EFA80147.1 cytochrome c heme-lyase [Heterostelium album PN500]|eukprot:XP_020432267.1 cytochrome c heme-lyase [Heterostelium album PN500]